MAPKIECRRAQAKSTEGFALIGPVLDEMPSGGRGASQFLKSYRVFTGRECFPPGRVMNWLEDVA